MVDILTARVRDGWIVLDRLPASLGLSEGDSINLLSAADLQLCGGALSNEDEQVLLDRELEEAEADVEAGRTSDWSTAMAELRATSEARSR